MYVLKHHRTFGTLHCALGTCALTLSFEVKHCIHYCWSALRCRYLGMCTDETVEVNVIKSVEFEWFILFMEGGPGDERTGAGEFNEVRG